jgi:hypothetical protein
MYPNPNKINSFIYYTSSGGNQMSIILNKNEADELLKLTYIECDSDSNYTDTDTNSTPTQSIELEDIFQPEWRKWPTDENFVEDNSKIKIITNIENENDLPLFFEYQELELLFKHPELYIQYEYLQVPIIDKWDHPIDNMTFVYTISINKGTSQITCVSEKYYKIGDLVNVDCYNKYFSINGINTNSIISEYISEYKGSKESEQLSNFFNWFKF